MEAVGAVEIATGGVCRRSLPQLETRKGAFPAEGQHGSLDGPDPRDLEADAKHGVAARGCTRGETAGFPTTRSPCYTASMS